MIVIDFLSFLILACLALHALWEYLKPIYSPRTLTLCAGVLLLPACYVIAFAA